MGVKGAIRSMLQGVRGWMEEPDHLPVSMDESLQVPFDNSYKWLWATMLRVMKDPVAAKRPQYVWGVLQGAALGKVLGLKRVSVMEIGVAGGAVLLAIERVAELFEESLAMKNDVY